MPEYREVLASFFTVRRWLRSNEVQSGPALTLQAIWADATKAEQEKKNTPARGRKGFVYKLEPDSQIMRGTNGAQQMVYPPTWPEPKAAETKPPVSEPPASEPPSSEPRRPLSDLVLNGVYFDPRTLILDFKLLWLQVQLHTHVTAQVYTRAQWDDSICAVNSTDRGFKVAAAFDFGSYVLAFVTIDILFTPHWASTRAELPIQHSDIYTEPLKFMACVADWIETRILRTKSNRDSLAIQVIRTIAHEIFGGMGVYTVCEVFFLAGLSPFLTEAELFNHPNRVYRLCAAYWVFAQEAHTKMEDELLRPNYHEFVLTASVAARQRFISYVHVFGKASVFVSQRMWDAHHDYEDCLMQLSLDEHNIIRGPDVGLFDVFEPDFLRPAFLDTCPVEFGPLIFGESHWVERFNRAPSVPGAPLNPLTLMYRNLELHTNSSHLNLDRYPSLFSENPKARILSPRLFNGQKAIWTVYGMFPENIIPPVQELKTTRISTSVRDIQLAAEAERKTSLLSYIIEKTRKAAVGPLEYCGLGRIIYRQRAGHENPL
ncbi:hypothetical protein BV25DRAFT_1918289 [Artomyces pyxidatus]|uniref:Uncharacterized protein n=1 Tax=Artomyces pyxidatus TaxID=48021 RepID=A0ACB8SSX5_9AGAM|nr:hypothetical protein BV25DRAFT_1918289 [Artomyces pyxidatus]